MENIVLIDPTLIMIHSVVLSEKIKIDTLIVGCDADVEPTRLKYDIGNILSIESINNYYIQQKINLDYSIIKEFKATELKVNQTFSRLTSDTNAIQNIYYSALFYWIKRFKENNIGGVMSSNIEFGSAFDSVIFDIAVFFDKQVYISEVGLSNGLMRTNQLFDYRKKKHLPIMFEKYSLQRICKKDFFYNPGVQGALEPIKYDSIRSFVKTVLYSLGGWLLSTMPLVILNRFKMLHQTFPVDWLSILKNYFYTKKMAKYYRSLCVSLDASAKYIYFPLHMEPEAATQNRTIASNQIIIIKTISQNLPEGWFLYVKEHPHQYEKLNSHERYYFLTTINKFRTKRFYDEIKSISNVRFLSTSIGSEEILKGAQAVATINGTIILESISSKIPVLAFSQNTTPFTMVDGVFDVKSNIMCKKYLKLIADEYVPDVVRLDEVIENYFYLIENDEKNNFGLLVEDLFCPMTGA